jgi:uncharacterized protein (DUF2235 family)
MPKNIVILLDGTSNEIRTDRSNILRLYGTLTKSEDQLVYYDPGVGTFGADNAWSRIVRNASEIWGMATGWGLDVNVKEAYRFLVENYTRDAKGARDRIYIFGFSRGAYTARVLAGFLHAFGLLEQRNLNLLDYAYRAYKRIGESAADDQSFAEMRLHERIIRPDRPPVRLLGLFDTVASVIESGRFGPRLRQHAFTRSNPSVEAVRHAVAMSERRTMFRPQLWPENQVFATNHFTPEDAAPQDAKEVWFAGVHGDVGGGYPESESGLAKFPLYWMIEETKETELDYKTRTVNELVLGKREDRSYVAPNAMAEMHDSMTWGWRILEYLPKRKPAGSQRPAVFGWTIPLSEHRHIPEGARVHTSALQGGKLIPNLPEHFTEDNSAMPGL